MSDPSEFVAHSLERMRHGDDEDAFFALIEADPVVLPLLIEAFAKEDNRGIRALVAARTELPPGRREWVDEALEPLGRGVPRGNTFTRE